MNAKKKWHEVENRDFHYQLEERDNPCPFGFEEGMHMSVPWEFGGGVFEAPIGALYGDQTRAGIDLAAVVLRLCQYGVAPTLHRMVEVEPGCFDLETFISDNGFEASLIGATLEAYWLISSHYGGGAALADQYADAVAALLAGGASRHVINGISLFAAWPVVERVYQRTGARLAGWVSQAYMAKCWGSIDRPVAGAVVPAAVAAEDAEALA